MMPVSNKEPTGKLGDTMHIDITRKTAFPALIGFLGPAMRS
jgi:hypothetical protein